MAGSGDTSGLTVSLRLASVYMGMSDTEPDSETSES